MTSVPLVQVRCRRCNRRLADVVNEVREGQAIVGFKCARCGEPHVEVIQACPGPGEPDQHAVR